MRRLTGRIQGYEWGSTTSIPQLLGIEPTEEPFAEYWLGAHASAPSLMDGESLAEYISAHPDVLGEQSRTAFGDRLPYLLKILAAERPLSLQAHPTAEQARGGFARENKSRIPLDAPNRTYRDDWPKPEALVALTPFDGLCGFRDPHLTTELFVALDVLAPLDGLIGPLTQRLGAAGMQEVFLEVLSLGEDQQELCEQVVSAAIKQVDAPEPLGTFARTAVELDECYPSDPGILAALLLNRFHLEPGEGLFLSAGVMHAYLHGTCVEVMANSDNVIRGGLTRKHIDVDELIQVVDFSSSNVNLAPLIEVAPGVRQLVTPAAEFVLTCIDAGDHTCVPDGGARILVMVHGSATLSCDGVDIDLARGEAAFLPDSDRGATLSGSGQAYLAGPVVDSTPG